MFSENPYRFSIKGYSSLSVIPRVFNIVSDDHPHTLILFEFPDEIDMCVNVHGGDFLRRPENAIIAYQPRTQALLRRQGISHSNTHSFFGRQGHEICLSLTDKVIHSIRTSISIKDELGVEEGYNNILTLSLRLLLHECLFLSVVLDRAVGRLKPESIIYPQPAMGFSELLLGRSERILGEIVRQYCKKMGIQAEMVPRNEKLQKPSRLIKVIKKSGIGLAFPAFLAVYARCFKKRIPIMAPVQSHGLPAFMGKIQETYPLSFQTFLEFKTIGHDIRRNIFDRNFWSFMSLPGGIASRTKKRFEETVKQNMDLVDAVLDKEKNSVRYLGMDFTPILKLHMTNALLPRLLDLHARTNALNRVLLGRKPALVVSQNAVGIGCTLGELCRKYGIPSLLISHGSHVPPKNRFESIEWGDHGLGLMNSRYEYLSVQTPWAAKYLRHFPATSKTLFTGPLIFAKKAKVSKTKDDLRNRLLPKVNARWIILHAGTPKGRGTRRFYVYETVDEYVANINSLIRAVETLEDTYLVVRFRPAPMFNVNDLETLLVKSEIYGIHPEGSFENFMAMADLLVSYSSTTIEEALQNRLPVLQYDPQGKYYHVPGQRLSKGNNRRPDSCYFVGSERDLVGALSWIIDNHLSKGELSESAWAKHVFPEDALVDVLDEFGHFFTSRQTSF